MWQLFYMPPEDAVRWSGSIAMKVAVTKYRLVLPLIFLNFWGYRRFFGKMGNRRFLLNRASTVPKDSAEL